MNAAILWFLIIGATSSNTSPTVVARFTNESECMQAAEAVRMASDKRAATKGMWMAHMNGFCIPVRAGALQ